MKNIKLKVENITVEIENNKIIENVFLNLYDGEIVAILGVSGSGKTTLFNVIAGLIIPKTGVVTLENENITGKTGKVSYMLQKDMLLPFKKIIDNVSLPLIINGMKKKEAREKVKKFFSIFGLEGVEYKYPSELSGGMKQRVALLRTYMFSKKIFLLDEPFSALDAITKNKIHKWYLEIMKTLKISTIFITHDIDEAILLSDRIYILGGNPGKIIEEIKIELNRDIDNKDEIQLCEKYIDYKRKILKYL